MNIEFYQTVFIKSEDDDKWVDTIIGITPDITIDISRRKKFRIIVNWLGFGLEINNY